MRQAQREITERTALLRVLDKCQTIRLGLHDKEYPYVVPLSFGWEEVDGTVNIFFHCAKEGKKVDLLAENGRVCVEADTLNGYKKTEHGVTADYESVIAYGQAREVCGKEAVHGIDLLLRHCGIDGFSPEACVRMNMVAVYKIVVEKITGKKRFL